MKRVTWKFVAIVIAGLWYVPMVASKVSTETTLTCQFHNDKGKLIYSIAYRLNDTWFGKYNGTATTIMARVNGQDTSKIIWEQARWAGDWGYQIFQFDGKDNPDGLTLTHYRKEKHWTSAHATFMTADQDNKPFIHTGA